MAANHGGNAMDKIRSLVALTAALTLALLVAVQDSHAQDAAGNKASLENRVQALENWINTNDPSKAKPDEPAKNSAVKSALGNVNIGGLLQVWGLNDPTGVFGANSDAETTMRLRRSEIRLYGDIIPEVGFNVMIDPAKQIKLNTKTDDAGEITSVGVDQSTNVLQDLWITLRPSKMFPGLEPFAPNMELQIGQQKMPVTEEGYRSSSKLDMVERSIIGRTYGDFRDQGILLKDSYKYFDYYLGLFNGSGRNKTDDNNEKNGTGRVVFKPFSPWKLGVSGQKGSSGANEADVERLGGDTQIEYGPASIKAEYMYGKDGEVDGQGFYVQPGFFLIPDKLQLVGRYDHFDPNSDKNDDRVQEIAAALNWFLYKHNAKAQFEYMRRNNDAANDENVVLVNLQAAF